MEKIVLLMALVSIIAATVMAEGVNWGDADATSQENFEKNFKIDPDGGFANAPEKSWKALENNPELMKDPEMLRASFNKDKSRASKIIDANPYLIDDENVLLWINAEAENDISIINNNKDLKQKWFSVRGIKISDEDVSLERYWSTMQNGKSEESIKTKGFAGTGTTIPLSFVSLVNGDGSVITHENIRVEASTVSQLFTPEGTPYYVFDRGRIFTKYVNEDVRFAAVNGAVVYSKDGKMTYVSSSRNTLEPFNPVVVVSKGGKETLTSEGIASYSQVYPMEVSLETPTLNPLKGQGQANTECENCVSLEVVVNQVGQSFASYGETIEALQKLKKGLTEQFSPKKPSNPNNPSLVAEVYATTPEGNGKKVGEIYDGGNMVAQKPGDIEKLFKQVVQLPGCILGAVLPFFPTC